MKAANSAAPGRHYLRRTVFFTLIVLTTLVALGLLISVFQKDGISPLEAVLLALYTVLILWISASFWSSLAGFMIRWTGRDHCAITAMTGPPKAGGAEAPPRTVILAPIYNEDTERVFAGLKSVYQSLVATGQDGQFEFFIHSGSRDPDIWVEEERLWHEMCEELNAKGRIFYRNRPEEKGRKCGNVADFCRLWGGRYRYMVVFDADSIMSGATLVEMVRLMERHPRVGLIQVPPIPVNRESLFSRIIQFAGNIYGSMFTAGLNFWQLSEGNYWGHNAIIRVRAFTECCGIPDLPGKEPFGGEILSHDFVEAALLRRGGWEVWLAYDLDGSYEEIPPTLIDYAKRDRRWCQGNLQHLGLVTARGFHPLSRLHFLMGVMSYLASPLWFLFLVVTGVEAYIESQQLPVYFFGENLAPVWPVSFAVQMTTVLVVTLAMLFLPKLLALLLLLKDADRRRAYGGMLKASLSVLLESLFSVLLAPVLMLFQSKFVLAILFRRDVGWPPQRRGDHPTSFKEALIAHGGQTLLGLAAGVLTYYYVPDFFWWLTPVLLGMVLAIPLSMLSSHVSLGRTTRRWRLFLTPQEFSQPRVLKLLEDNLQRVAEKPAPAAAVSHFAEAISNPFVNALHVSLQPAQSLDRRRRHYLEGLSYRVLDDGPDSLSGREKRDLLLHQETLLSLHTWVWSQTAVMGPDYGDKGG